MGGFRPELLPVSIGSLPHQDPAEACAAIWACFPHLPSWPQLPQRSFLENMYVQFGGGFPGLVLEEDRIYVDRRQDLSADLERLYRAYLGKDLDGYAIGDSYAAGLAEWSGADFQRCRAVKGQVIGPVSWALTVVDQDLRPVLYDEILVDAVAKHLRLKAMWQERELRRLHPTTIILLDDAYMSSFRSAYVALSREQAIALIEEGLGGLRGLQGG